MGDFTCEKLNKLLNNNLQVSNANFLHELLSFEKNITVFDDTCLFQLYLNLGNLYCFENEPNALKKAKSYILKAEKLLDFINNYELSRDFFFTKGHLMSRLNDKNAAHEYFVRHILLMPKNGLNILDTPLYSFRKIDKFLLNDLINNSLTVTNPKKFNDPFDTLLFIFLQFRKKFIKYNIKPLIQAYSYFKIKCFVKDGFDKNRGKNVDAFRNILMWSHYANSHKGICIRYKFFPPPIDYLFTNIITKWHPINYVNEVSFGENFSESNSLLFATKQECWEYEHEIRLLHFDREFKQNYKQIPLSELGGKIEAVFFGIKCIRYKTKIKEILKD